MKILRLKTEWALILGMILGTVAGIASQDFFVGASLTSLITLITVAINYSIGDKRKSDIQKSNKSYYVRVNSESGDVFK
ncbi:hypothetical protein CPT_MarsHill_018 [Staphylococcus phage MarsHill]|nr:hypothetical protein CPT_MarsHill_018 [Staphylococcus phage MarsHill]QQO92675.1 hypothetical protein CPT_Madawaska_018 [Staphylococcus phage Madawaska]